MKLNIEPNLADPDAFYERLIDTHAGLSDTDSHALNVRLVHRLSALIADPDVLAEAAALAERGAPAAGDTPEHVAKLVLLLANHLGDMQRIALALEEARAQTVAAARESV